MISWKSLSTFYALTSRSGPWKKYIVMTNINGCRHIGKKNDKDLSICIKTFQNMSSFDWLKLAGDNNINVFVSNNEKLDNKNLPLNELQVFTREQRLKYYSEI